MSSPVESSTRLAASMEATSRPREVGVYDAQVYAEEKPLLERERQELEGLRGPAAGRLSAA
jgi:hypothetical protein